MSKANVLRARAQGILDYFKPEEYDEGFELRSVPKVKPRDQYGKPVVEGGYDAAPTVTLSDLEGYPYLSTMSDRTAAGGQVVGIGDKNLAYPVNLTGGQDFMRDGLLWASGTMPINQMLQAGSNLKQQYGRNPALINWRMTPSGSDFSGEMTSGVMMSYASANMPAAVKKKLNADIRDRVPDFVGIDDPRAPAQIAMQPDRVRKFIQQQIMDKGYRDKGGISLPQARLAIADPSQLKAPTMGFQNVGLLDVDAGNLSGQGNIIYPDAVAGDFIGRLDTDATLIDLDPTAQYKSAGGIYGRPLSMGDFGPRKAFSDIRRAAEVSPYGGIIDEDLLRRLEAKGIKISANPLATAASLGLLGAAALGSEEADASILAKLPSVARLADKGFDTDNIYYHGTETFDDDELDLFRNDIGFHVGAKDHANERLKQKAFPYDLDDGDVLPDDPYLYVEPAEGEFFPIAGDESRIMPFYLRKGEVLDLPDFRDWDQAHAVINGMLRITKESGRFSDPKFSTLIDKIKKIKEDILRERESSDLAKRTAPYISDNTRKNLDVKDGELLPLELTFGEGTGYDRYDESQKYLKKIRNAIQESGYDTIRYTNLYERPDGKPMFGEDQYSYIVLDGKNIRSVNAAALDDESSNIMSGVTGVAGASGLLAAGQSEEADASIVGVVSKLGFSRKDMLETAKLMEVEGQDKESIFRATGWERSGADGKWRTELPNTNSKIDLDFLEEKYLVDFVSGNIELLGADDIDVTEETIELWEFFDDPELLDQYQPKGLKDIADDRHFADKYDMPREPLTMEQSDLIEKYGEPRYLANYGDLEADEKVRGSRVAGSLKDIKVVITNELPPKDAYYNDYADKIYIGAGVTQQEFRSLLLHELQHAIQAREGFARGSDPEYIEQVQTISDQYFNRGGQDEIDRLTALAEKYEAALRKGDTSQSTIEEAQAAQNLRTQKNRGLINEAMRKIQRNIDPNEELYVPPFRIYQETAGEVEARNVELRDQTRTLEAAEGESSIDQIPFYLTEKYASATVPQERQLVIYDNLVDEIIGPYEDTEGLFDDISVSKPITESAKESNAAIQKAKPALEKLSAPTSSTYEYGPTVVAKAEAEALQDAARLVAKTFEDGFRMLVGGLGSAVEPESGRYQAQMDKPSFFGDYNQSTKDAMALLGDQVGEVLMPAINFVMNPLFNTPSPISGRSLKQSLAKEITNIQDVYYSLPEPVQEEVAPRIGYAALAAMGALTFYLPLKPKTPKVEIPLLPEDNQGLLQIAN